MHLRIVNLEAVPGTLTSNRLQVLEQCQDIGRQPEQTLNKENLNHIIDRVSAPEADLRLSIWLSDLENLVSKGLLVCQWLTGLKGA